MPKSRSRRKPTSRPRATTLGREEPSRQKRRASPWRKRVGWPISILGLALFLIGNIGARTGIVILPFDPHHAFGQLGGAIMAFTGLFIATSK